MEPTTAEEILSRLERCELELQAGRAYVKALEHGLHAIVATHPDPKALDDLWAHVLPELADEHATDEAQSPLFRAAFQQALATMTRQINGAAERRQ